MLTAKQQTEMLRRKFELILISYLNDKVHLFEAEDQMLQACKEADLRFAWRRIHQGEEPYWQFEEIEI